MIPNNSDFDKVLQNNLKDGDVINDSLKKVQVADIISDRKDNGGAKPRQSYRKPDTK